MARYAIINLEKLNADAKNIDVNSPEFKAVKEAVEHYQSAILSPEETEAKFLNVWTAGFDRTYEILTNSYEGKAEQKYPSWSDFKKTL